MENFRFDQPEEDKLSEKPAGGFKNKLQKATMLGAIVAATLSGEGCSPDKKTESEDAKFLQETTKLLQHMKEDSEKSHPFLIKSYHQHVNEGQLPLQGMLAVTPEAVARARELALENHRPVGKKKLEVLEVRGYVPTLIKVDGVEYPHFYDGYSLKEREMIEGVERARGIKKGETLENQQKKIINYNRESNKISEKPNVRKGANSDSKPLISGADDF